MLGTKPDLRQSTIRFSPPSPSYPPSTTLLLPSLAALHQCPVPLETLVRHPRRVVHTYEDLRLTVLGLCLPTPPHARVSWGLAIAVANSVFCNRRFSHAVVVCAMRLFASFCATAFALTNFSPTPWAPLELDGPPPCLPSPLHLTPTAPQCTKEIRCSGSNLLISSRSVMPLTMPPHQVCPRPLTHPTVSPHPSPHASRTTRSRLARRM